MTCFCPSALPLTIPGTEYALGYNDVPLRGSPQLSADPKRVFIYTSCCVFCFWMVIGPADANTLLGVKKKKITPQNSDS